MSVRRRAETSIRRLTRPRSARPDLSPASTAAEPGTYRLSYRWDGQEHELVCFDNPVSRMMNTAVLEGDSYPRLNQTFDVRVVLDIGANVGASTVWFSHLFPGAVIHAFEPAPAPFELLARNTSGLAGIHIHRFGLFSEDRTLMLYDGSEDSGTASVFPNPQTAEGGQLVELRSISQWLDEADVSHIDVLKIDTEGCELSILLGLGERLKDIPVVYLEYHSESDRRDIDDLLAPSHVLAGGRALRPHLGELAYVACEVFQADDASLDTEIRIPDHFR